MDRCSKFGCSGPAGIYSDIIAFRYRADLYHNPQNSKSPDKFTPTCNWLSIILRKLGTDARQWVRKRSIKICYDCVVAYNYQSRVCQGRLSGINTFSPILTSPDRTASSHPQASFFISTTIVLHRIISTESHNVACKSLPIWSKRFAHVTLRRRILIFNEDKTYISWQMEMSSPNVDVAVPNPSNTTI